MIDRLNQLESTAVESLTTCQTLEDITILRTDFLGKSGKLTSLLKEVGKLPKEERPQFGKLVNEVKARVGQQIDEYHQQLAQKEQSAKIMSETIDVTLPGKKTAPAGHKHPLVQTAKDIQDIFSRLGYKVAEGPDIESEYYNFESLNFPADHPARDMHDTFFVEGGYLLRTHTSPVQIRVMEKQKPPLKVLMPGRVYRNDETDASHSPVFHQVEGLVVDEGITFADLKGTLEYFIHCFFGKEKKVRFRPSFFPFTEPSAEVDVQCIMCKGKGCRVCKGSGWLEILGAGMVDPNVFGFVNVDTEKYSGFAFGMGVERIAMLRYGIDDIRLFYENDLRFLEQF
ncbi:phenylalanine--tRNA ligase subunit alpha [Candidatus Margulisiibacteriota bacterium]